ncbi:caspase recruitment domain-containing protein 14 [Denticeps clupeoides]|uniref:caspase recruitment domain-containing protein 14 n=1 Tax=Denticeps clupeoides TaxID=299321 RepID=UPI0010A49839|nr:caspase recruitment domain-containing protein 14 [Denticeps clupeoides]
MDPEDPDGEDLWKLIDDHRHRISLRVRPCTVIPYLRQARVLSEIDEDEVMNSHQLTNRSMRTSHMLDLLHIRGRNGAVALLDSLMIHYPDLYTQITGRKPSIEPSGFSGVITYSELTDYLVRAVSSMQKELQQARVEGGRMREHCASLEAEQGCAEERREEQLRLQEENGRMRTHMSSLHRDLLKLKDEKCDLYVRYAAAVDEKSALAIRCRDLNLQVYQMQCELRKTQEETAFQRRLSLRCASLGDTQKLREEISTLKCKLMEAETFTPAREDILAQDLEEARDGRSELADQLRRISQQNERLVREAEEMYEEKEGLTLQVQKLTLDCEMYQQKSNVFQSQMSELQAERDRAYLSRDDAQAQIARSLAEKDTLRGQLVELQEKVFTLRARSAECGARDKSRDRKFSWENSSHESSCDCGYLSPRPRSRLRRMDAISPEDLELSDGCLSSIRSNHVEPPCSRSLRRREMDHDEDSNDASDDCPFSFQDMDSDFVVISENDVGVKSTAPPALSKDNCNLDSPASQEAANLFLVRSRPQALRITGRILVLTFQGEALLSQIQVIGGNKTGIFVHQVTEGSSAHAAGVIPGAQILEVKYEHEQGAMRMVLEDTTQEEARWALGQVRGSCHVSFRPNQDAYDNLMKQLKTGEILSGDSFYVRVNVTLASGLSVKCNDVLHVTNTCHNSEGSWWASLVHPCQLLDLKSGSIPNYYRAQRLLIRSIEDMTFQHKAHRKVERVQGKQKAVRIVSAGRQLRSPLWVSVEDNSPGSAKPFGHKSTHRSTVALMPYTLVTPHYPPVCRPVLLLPTVLGRVLHKHLAQMEGYQLCEPEILSSEEHTQRLEKGGVLEECQPTSHRCYTIQGVEKIMKQGTHCVLPLGLDCVRCLHRAEIFPIIIFITSTERSVRRLRHKLRQNGLTEAKLLECSRAEEPLLDKLPCLYRSVEPDSWSDTSLLDTVQYVVAEEQAKIVWVESDLW